MIHPGSAVEAQDAFGVWLRAVAVSRLEGINHGGRRTHSFPVIWVRFADGSRLPWPAESVRHYVSPDATPASGK